MQTDRILLVPNLPRCLFVWWLQGKQGALDHTARKPFIFLSGAELASLKTEEASKIKPAF